MVAFGVILDSEQVLVNMHGRQFLTSGPWGKYGSRYFNVSLEDSGEGLLWDQTCKVKRMLRPKALPILGTFRTKPKTCLNNSLYILIQHKTEIFTLCISVGVPQWTVRVMSVVPSLSVVKDNMTHLKPNRQEVKLQRRSVLLLTGTDRRSPPGTSHQPSAYDSTRSSGWRAGKTGNTATVF